MVRIKLQRTRSERRKLFVLIFACLFLLTFFVNAGLIVKTANRSPVVKAPLRGDRRIYAPSSLQIYNGGTGAAYEPRDAHPISKLIKEANERWQRYEDDRSTNFRQTVVRYRQKYGRHPPPGFKEWYIFARERNVHNVDDFEQIIDDLRPFWAIEPQIIRKMAAKLPETDGISGLHIRKKRVAKVVNVNWRSETLAQLISRFVQYLPDMDIAMNNLDQPRVVVPFEDLQKLLEVELRSRKMVTGAKDRFTQGMDHLLNFRKKTGDWDEHTNPEWFSCAGKPYMDVAKLACPPESPARDPDVDGDKLYKTELGGFVANFNLSTDLCTVGPEIHDQHGFLYAASTIIATRRLVPVFSECKVSVNNDILFPANMYSLKDTRYVYDPSFDYEWDDKADNVIWRGVTSGGVQNEGNWRTMHRQRLVQFTNSTLMDTREVSILSERGNGKYEPFGHFKPYKFAEKHFDVGFTESWGCDPPGCGFYNNVWTYKGPVMLSEQFANKFLVDVDGHSFSGRWRAFHFSKSLGIKATIFREWHDSRLFAWRHFVPLDNRYDDLYSIMTYFVGTGTPHDDDDDDNDDNVHDAEPYVPEHDFEAQILAMQSRSWAQQVLRDEDIEIYMFRLLLEYARIIDDNRNEIGYSGDGSELDEFDKKHPIPASLPSFDWMRDNDNQWS